MNFLSRKAVSRQVSNLASPHLPNLDMEASTGIDISTAIAVDELQSRNAETVLPSSKPTPPIWHPKYNPDGDSALALFSDVGVS